jgi:hypothetical protein
MRNIYVLYNKTSIAYVWGEHTNCQKSRSCFPLDKVLREITSFVLTVHSASMLYNRTSKIFITDKVTIVNIYIACRQYAIILHSNYQ